LAAIISKGALAKRGERKKPPRQIEEKGIGKGDWGRGNKNPAEKGKKGKSGMGLPLEKKDRGLKRKLWWGKIFRS